MAKYVAPQKSSCSTKIALVAEALGADEDKEEAYLVGRSGQFLDRCFKATGFRPRLILDGHGRLKEIKDNGIYITNVIKERPPKNRISHFIDLNRKEPLITEAAQAYIEELRGELSAVDCNVIIACGAVSLYVLTGILGLWKQNKRGSSITNWWGSIIPSTLVPGKKVIPMIHPAAALRQHLHTYTITRTLIRVKEEAKAKRINNPHRNLIIDPSFSEVCKFFGEIEKGELVAFDIETAGEMITCFSLSTNSSEAICIPFVDERFNRMFSAEEEEEIWASLRFVFDSCTVLCHNTTYEYQYLLETKGIELSAMEDTMLMQRVLYPDLPASLGFCTAWFTKQPYYKDMDDQFLSGKTDIEEYWKYNALDSAVLHDIYPTLRDELSATSNWEHYRNQVELIPPLAQMQVTGIKADMEGVKKAYKRCWEEWWELFDELEELVRLERGGAPLPKKDHKQFFLDGKRLIPREMKKKHLTKQGDPSILALKKEFGADRIEVVKHDGFKEKGEWVLDPILDPAFPNSDAQKKRYFYDFLGIKPYLTRKREAKDKRRIDEWVMRRLARKGYKEAEIINKMAKLHKLATTYFNPKKYSKDGRWRYSYSFVKTGRLNSSETTVKGEGGYSQNLPPTMKELLIDG